MNLESFVRSLVFVGTSALVMNPLSFVKSEVFVGRSLNVASLPVITTPLVKVQSMLVSPVMVISREVAVEGLS